MNMMQNMAGVNPMQQIIQNAVQQALMPMMGGGQTSAPATPNTDDFALQLDSYCREVAEGRRAMPHAVKEFFGVAWHGAKDAVQEHYGQEAKDSARNVTAESFWDSMDCLRVCNREPHKMAAEIVRLFPNATSEQQMVLREMATEKSMSEHAQRIGLNPDAFKNHLKQLMHEHEH